MIQTDEASLPQIPGYDIVEILGEGASGIVYLGLQLITGRKVAVKVLKDQSAFVTESTEIDIKKRRFERETKIVAELNHPNIVQLLDKGETRSNSLFAAFQYVPGTTLKDNILKTQQLTVAKTVDIMSQVLDGLICAHRAGIIHRDIKPQNLIISDQSMRSHAMILDYGIGAYKETHARATLESFTLDKEMLGTPAYASPEQLCGMPVSTGSDLYAWALVFLECLLGRTIFMGASVADIILQKLSGDEIRLPTAIASHPMGDILAGCLKKDPSERESSAEKVFTQLKSIDYLNFVDFIKLDSLDPRQTEPSILDETHITNPEYRLSGERRQITVMSCGLDLVTLQGPDVDIEDSEDSLKQCKSLVKTIAHQHGAYLANEFSDSLVFYFGYPRISEFNARNAANAALSIMKKMKGDAQFPDISIGIHTGFFRLLERALPEGVTAYIAKKLEQQAMADETLVSRVSQQLLKPYFTTTPLPRNQSDSSEHVFLLQGQRTDGNQSKHFIGRSAELNFINDVLDSSASREKKVVLISGEPGIGKSSLLRQIDNTIATHGRKRIVLKCAQEHSSRMLFPFIEFVKKSLGIEATTETDVITEIIRETLKDLVDVEELIPILLTWLCITLKESIQPTQLSGNKQRIVLAQALAILIRKYHEKEKIIILIDDFQWADSLTLSFFDDYIEIDSSASAVLIASTRPAPERHHYSADWLRISLNAISAGDSRKVIEALLNKLDKHLFPEIFIEEIIARSEGIPLYIEQMTLMLIECCQEKNSERDLDQLLADIPFTLRELLTARLDTIGPSKQLAQYASIIGREFDIETLHSISMFSLEQFEQYIEILSAAKIFTIDDNTCAFSHTLIHEAAYESVLNKDKKQIHGVISGLYAQDESKAKNSPELLAAHAQKAEHYSMAIKYWLEAARTALTSGDTATAQIHCDHATSTLPNIHPISVSNRLELEITSTKAYTLVAQRGYSDEDVKSIYTRAYTLIDTQTDSAASAPVVYGLFSYYTARANYRKANEYAYQLLGSGIKTTDLRLQLVAQNSLGLVNLLSGNLGKAKAALEQALSLSDKLGEHSLMPQFGGDFRGYCRSWYAILQALNGDIVAAKTTCRKALALCEGSQLTCAFILAFPAIEQMDGDADGAGHCAQKLIDISSKYGFDFFSLLGNLQSGWVQGHSGEPEQGIASINQTLQIVKQAALFSFLPRYYAVLAEIHMNAQNYSDALINLSEGIAYCRQARGNFYKAELFRLYAQSLVKLHASPLSIIRCLRLSFFTAFRQGALLWMKKTANTVEDIANANPSWHDITTLQCIIEKRLKSSD